MQKNDIKINLSVSTRMVTTVPEYTIKLDDHVLWTVTDSSRQDFLIVQSVYPGQHRLSIEFFNKNYKEIQPPKSDMAVIIDSIRFQNIKSDFKVYSKYQPTYPDDWLGNKDKIVHANYLGWNGIWYIDFETPIYPWIHQRLDLGWLL
jgi:hypothetical protein